MAARSLKSKLSGELNTLRQKYLDLGMTERDFSIAVMKYCCDSQDLTLQAILSNGGRYCQADP